MSKQDDSLGNCGVQQRFQGFEIPKQNWFRVPDEWSDITADIDSLAEMKVVEYVLKHTWGYQEYGLTKRITTDEFRHGRKRKDGSRIDRGTGLSKQSVITGLKKAVERGLLIEEVDARDKARVRKSYALRMKDHIELEKVSAVPSGVTAADVQGLDICVNVVEVEGQEVGHRTEKDHTVRKYSHNISSDISERSETVEALERLGLSHATAIRLVENYGEERAREKLKFLDFLMRNRPDQVSRPAGWARRAIEEDYSAPDGFQRSIDMARETEKRNQRCVKTERMIAQKDETERRRRTKKKEELEALLAHRQSQYETDIYDVRAWKRVLKHVRDHVSTLAFQVFLRVYVLKLAEDSAVLAVTSEFERRQILQHVGTGGALTSAVSEVVGQTLEPEILVLYEMVEGAKVERQTTRSSDSPVAGSRAIAA